MRTEKSIKNWISACLLLAWPQQSFASGYAIFTHGATALGEGLASTAHGSNPEVIFYNPALISKLEGTQVENGVTLVVPRHDFRSNLENTTSRTESEVFFPSTFYFTHQYDDKLSVGVGIFSPFGLGIKWKDDWVGRYITTQAEMRTFTINPAIAYRLSPAVSIAAGVDVLRVATTLRNKINFSSLGLADGNQKFSGDGTGYGYNLGFYSELTRTIAFGLSYRSKIQADIDGHATFGLPSGALSSAFPDTAGQTSITFPDQLHAAFAYSGIDKLTVELGLRWEGWSSYDELRVELAQPVNGATTVVTPKNWRNTLTLTMGGRYRLSDGVHLLAGYVRGEDPIPDDTFDPIVTDSPHYALTFGTEIDYKKYRWSFAYAYQNWSDRSKNNAVGAAFSGGTVADARANGNYAAASHFLAASFTYVF